MPQFDRQFTRLQKRASAPAANRISTEPASAARDHSQFAAPAAPLFDFDFGRTPIAPATGASLSDQEIHRAANFGAAGPGGPLPYAGVIQSSFGQHPVNGIIAHLDANAGAAAHSMRARAFATNEHVAFAVPPTLRTAAHEAAHVV